MKDLTASWIAGTKQHANTNKDFDAQAALAARRPLIFLALFVLFDLAPSAEKLRRQLVAGLLLRQPAFRCRLRLRSRIRRHGGDRQSEGWRLPGAPTDPPQRTMGRHPNQPMHLLRLTASLLMENGPLALPAAAGPNL